MTATNHALTGALIGLIVGEPLIALPAALASHYVCDAIPHYRSAKPMAVLLKTKGFRNYLVAEAVICAALVAVLAIMQPAHWLLASFCAFLAAAPDLLSINRYVTVRSGRAWKPGWYTRVAMKIQWFERPIGAVVEAVWFIGCVIILSQFLR